MTTFRDEAERYERESAWRCSPDVIAACPLCDADGYALPRRVQVCDHDPDRQRRNEVGIARVRAALAGFDRTRRAVS